MSFNDLQKNYFAITLMEEIIGQRKTFSQYKNMRGFCCDRKKSINIFNVFIENQQKNVFYERCERVINK